MQKVFAVFLFCVGLFCLAQAQVPMTGAGKGAPGGGSSTTTFDPSNKGSNITLSGGNLIATSGSTGTPNTSVLSVASHSTGKFYLEWKWTNVSTGQDGFGVANSSYLVASDEIGFNTVNRSAAVWSDDAIYLAGSVKGNMDNAPPAANDVLAMAVDRGGQLIWFANLTRANGWNASLLNNPATGVGGIDISAMGAGAYFFGTQLETSGNSATVNTGGSAYFGTPPVGYGNW